MSVVEDNVVVGLLFVFIVLLLGFAFGAWLWTYSINAWLVYAGKTAVVQWWQGGLIGFCPVIGKLCIPVAVVTWIFMLTV